jgi:hypothetical protein
MMHEPETTAERQRRSPEYRHTPLRKLVLDPPLKVPDSYLSQIGARQPKPRERAGRLAERSTPLGQEMVEGVPADGRWYLAAICYSSGEATSLCSHINRAGYGAGVEASSALVPNKNKHGMKREHVVLVRRS